MSDSPVGVSLEGAVAVLRLDDGKANAISHTVLEALHAGLDRAEKEANAVLLLGRPGRFSAGFDLGAMGAGPESMRSLVSAGAEFLMRVSEAPLPIVVGCTGHALAMGGLMLLAADQRIGIEGPFKIGLNEVSIGMTLPNFGVELGAERLSRRHVLRAIVQAEIYDPATAVDAGFLDRVVAADALEAEATAVATALGGLPRGAFSATKRALRGALVERVRAGLAADMAGWGAA